MYWSDIFCCVLASPLFVVLVIYEFVKCCFCGDFWSAPKALQRTDENPADQPPPLRVHIGSEVVSDGHTPYEEARPCSICEDVSLEGLLSPGGHLHHKSYGDLERSARAGCRLCAVLLLAIERGCTSGEEAECLKLFRAKRGPKTTLRLKARRGDKSENSKELRSDLVEISIGTDTGATAGTSSGRHVVAHIGLYTDQVSLTANIIPGRRLPCSLGDADAIDRVRNWVTEILDRVGPEGDPEHESRMVTLPRRVLHVPQKGNSVVKLVDSDDQVGVQGGYICLSHCWGHRRHFQLTMETLPQLKTGLDVSNFAKNFQDSIMLCQVLGISYLWIDALCILQDSLLDWEIESAKMGQYYRFSYLTISAGTSDGEMGGLLAKRAHHGLPYIKLHTKGHPRVSQYSRSIEDSRHIIYFGLDPLVPSTQCPIRTRGWTFQEEMLSPRWLSFENTQAYLKCGTILHHECGRQEDLSVTASPFLAGEQLLQRGEWSEIVMRYSSRNLTIESDKLPALSGLAHEYQVRWGDDYLAGLWRKNLWRGLLWRRNGAYTLPEPKRLAEFRAPSWSWASMDGRIEFETGVHDSRCHISSASTVPSGSDPMGQVSGGRIELEAVVIKMNIYGNIQKHLELDVQKIYDVPGEVRPESRSRDQFLMWITYTSGLVLWHSRNSDLEYQRIGYFSVTPSRRLDEFWSKVRWTVSPMSPSDSILVSRVVVV